LIIIRLSHNGFSLLREYDLSTLQLACLEAEQIGFPTQILRLISNDTR